MQQTVQ